MLFIVARDQPALYDALRREFSADEEILVLLDRRCGERRQFAVAAHRAERRAAERRQRNDVEGQLRSLGWAFVRSPRPQG
jgi:hypothetical protein